MRLEKNKDGKLAADEVGTRYQKIVSAADADQDGVATRQEIEASTQKQEAGSGGRPMTR